MEYKIKSRRYTEDGSPISTQHSIIVDTEKDVRYEGIDTNETLQERFESLWNTPQEDDGSRIRVTSIETI